MAVEDNKIDESGNTNTNGADEGANEGNNQPAGAANDESNNQSGEQNVEGFGKTFTQDEVTSMMTREKQQGRNSAYNKLGIDPSNEDMVAKVQDFVKSLAPQGDEAVAAAEQKLREAEAKVRIAETKAKLLEAGIVTNFVDDAMVLVNAKLDEDTDTSKAISELKKKFPAWFTTTNIGAQQFRGTGSNPQSQEGGSGSGDEKGSLGKRLAASKKSTQPKRSYFDRK